MSKILHNPENGAEIKNISHEGTQYFTTKEGYEFKVGDIVKIEDEKAADFILETYGFLKEVTPEEAKNIKERKENNAFKCDKCDFSTDLEKKLTGHKLHHAKEEKIDRELGIRVVTGKKKETKKGEVDTQSQIEQEALRDGLIGEGLTKE